MTTDVTTDPPAQDPVEETEGEVSDLPQYRDEDDFREPADESNGSGEEGFFSSGETEAMDRFWSLLEALAGESEATTITADGGKAYEVPAVLPARRQVRTLKQLRKIMKLGTESGSGTSLRAAFDTNIVVGLAEVFDLMDDEGPVFELIDRAMHEAFGPDKKGRGALADVLGDEVATDVFPIEEIVAALLPFVARLLQRLGDGIRPAVAALNQT